MSDSKQPELTPKEQQAQDHQRVQNQLIVTDVNRRVQDVMDLFPFGGSGTSGRTSFEGHELNAMIDLIENSSPEHLENAGEALLKARTAIKDAAKELGDFIRDVDWEGESGIAFRDWGKGLVAHATKLGDFAEAAGTQITVAGATSPPCASPCRRATAAWCASQSTRSRLRSGSKGTRNTPRR